jgi:Leucine rich repeat
MWFVDIDALETSVAKLAKKQLRITLAGENDESLARLVHEPWTCSPIALTEQMVARAKSKRFEFNERIELSQEEEEGGEEEGEEEEEENECILCVWLDRKLFAKLSLSLADANSNSNAASSSASSSASASCEARSWFDLTLIGNKKSHVVRLFMCVRRHCGDRTGDIEEATQLAFKRTWAKLIAQMAKDVPRYVTRIHVRKYERGKNAATLYAPSDASDPDSFEIGARVSALKRLLAVLSAELDDNSNDDDDDDDPIETHFDDYFQNCKDMQLSASTFFEMRLRGERSGALRVLRACTQGHFAAAVTGLFEALQGEMLSNQSHCIDIALHDEYVAVVHERVERCASGGTVLWRLSVDIDRATLGHVESCTYGVDAIDCDDDDGHHHKRVTYLARKLAPYFSAGLRAASSADATLRLSSRALRALDARTVAVCAGRVECMELANNMLSSLPDALSACCPSLRSLDLICNRFVTLPPQLLTLAECLVSLSLSNNDIEQLPAGIGRLTSLRHLRLAHNRLRRLPSAFKHLSQLETLTLARNELDRVPSSLSHLPALCSLTIHGNPCTAEQTPLKTHKHIRQFLRTHCRRKQTQ